MQPAVAFTVKTSLSQKPAFHGVIAGDPACLARCPVHSTDTWVRFGSTMWRYPRVNEALQWATELHQHQKRAQGEPYIVHPKGVAQELINSQATEDEVIAGLLHDVVEDQGGQPTQAALKGRFGDTVERFVMEASENLKEPDWVKRKQDYLDRILTASPSACMIIAADKLDNVRSACQGLEQMGRTFWDGIWPEEKWPESWVDETVWFYETACANLKRRWFDEPRMHRMVNELGQAIELMKQRIRETSKSSE